MKKIKCTEPYTMNKMLVGTKYMSSNSRLALSIVCFFIVILGSVQKIDAVSCLFDKDQVGQCVSFEDCPSAVALSKKGYTPSFCNLEEGIVCCTNNARRPSISNERRPHPEIQNDYPHNFQNGRRDPENVYDAGIDSQRRKHNNGKPIGNSNDNNHGRKKNSDDPYKFEKPGQYHPGSENKQSRRPNTQTSGEFYGDSHFPSSGYGKKKPWKDEKSTENDYHYEHVTKKPNRGSNRKGPNKNNENGYGSPKRPDEDFPGNDWSNEGERRRTTESYDWPNNQNDYENEYSGPRTTTRRSKWTQETYTTKRNSFSNNRPGNEYGYEDEYYNTKPTRRPHRTSTDKNQHRPGFGEGYNRPEDNFRPDPQQGFRPQGNNQPNQPGLRPQNNNRPNNHQGLRPEDSNFQQSSRPQGNNRPNSQQRPRPNENNRPNQRPGLQKKKRVSEQKCEEYSKQVTENITGLPLTTNPDPVVISVRKCVQPQQLIVGGENTTLGEFPHMAAIGFRDKNKKTISWNCGGTLISELFVMTAAHCTSTSLGRPVKVRLGEFNLMKNDDGAHPVDYAVKEIITHPDYKPPSKYHDIALLKLSRRVTFLKHIRPACLYAEDTFSVSMAIATGWGRVFYDGGMSEILQKVALTIVDNNTCNRLYKVNVKSEVLARGIIDSQMCAGELSGGKDTCQGDSGGPLSIVSTKCIHHVIGVTSFGKSCALPNSTGVYTRVSAYIPWIESVIWPSN